MKQKTEEDRNNESECPDDTSVDVYKEGALSSKWGRVLAWQWPWRMFTRLHYFGQY